MFGRFIWRIDAGEVLEFAAPRLFVEALRITLFGLRERSVDEYFKEFARSHKDRAPGVSSERNGEMN